MKEIFNAIFYYDKKNREKNALIIYDDGCVKLTSYEKGMEICTKYVKYKSSNGNGGTFSSKFISVINKKELLEKYSNVLPEDILNAIGNDDLCYSITSKIPDNVSEDDIYKINDKIEHIDFITLSNLNMDFDSSVSPKKSHMFKFIPYERNKMVKENDLPNQEVINNESITNDNDLKTELPKKKKTPKWLVILSFCLAVGIVCTIYGLTRKKDDNNVNGVSSSTVDQVNKNPTATTPNNNADLSPLKKMLDNTSSEVQKNAMANITALLHHFNSTFANGYVEKDKDIKAALSFDEMMALMCAYNDYSKDDIKAIFNGADINSTEMSWNYKNASLQLMGAYVIETKNYPLDLSHLINSEEGKTFYNKYHELFIKAKYAKGKERENLVKEFYDNVRSDFPITDAVRTDGISHAENIESLKSYKLSVTPMIAAAEMIFKDTNYSLDDSEINFLNDVGLCNVADHKFERIETIVLSSTADTKNPLYSDFRNTIIKMLKDNHEYVIDDKHRDLSKLETFKLIVNGRFDEVLNGDFTCVTTYSTESYTSYYETVTKTKKDIPKDVKKEIDDKIDQENAASKQDGERKAEENRQRIQNEEDKNASKVNSEVEAEKKDFQQRLDDSNKNSSNVNEDDFGSHGVDFDDDYSDENGNLDSSVKNITTDSSGDKSNEPLPDPNDTGKDFDNEAIGSTGTSLEDYADYLIDYYSSIDTDQDNYNYQYKK